MSGTGSRKPPLVAERRGGQAAGARAKTATKSRSGGSRPTGRGARPKRRRMIGGFTGFVLRTVWWIGSRTALALALIVAGFTAYYYTQLPPLESLLDGRARGSVTMLDREGQV
ncbi:MAG: glycosyl transferase, partial [Paracoccaceae bacterium]